MGGKKGRNNLKYSLSSSYDENDYYFEGEMDGIEHPTITPKNENQKHYNRVLYSISKPMVFAIGPSFGFLLSAQTTKLYVEFDRIPADEIPDIEQTDSQWIVPRRLGFAICGAFFVILGKYKNPFLILYFDFIEYYQ